MLEPTNQPLALPNGTDHARTTLAFPLFGAEVNGEPPGLSAAPTVSGLVQAFRRRWLLATSLAILGAAGAVLAVLNLLPAQYSAHARIQVASRGEQRLFTPSEETDFLIYKANLAAQIKSPLVVNAALNQVKDLFMVREQPKPVAWLETALKTDYLLAPEMLRLTLAGDWPEEVAKIVNAVTDAFLKEMELREKAKRQARLDELRISQRLGQAELHQKRMALRTRVKTDPAVLQDQYRAALGELGTAKKAALDKHLEKINAQQELDSLDNSMKNLDKLPVADYQIDENLKQLPAALQLFASMAKIEENMEIIRQNSAKPDVDLPPWEAKKAGLVKQMEDLRKQYRPHLEKKIRLETADKLRQQSHGLLDRISSLTKQEQILANEVNRREEEANRLKSTHLPLDVLALRDEITSMEAAQNKLNEMISAVTAEPVGTRVSLLQRAEVPSDRDYSRQIKIAGGAAVGVFGLLLLAVSWWEFRSRRISAADEVVVGLKMSLVGTLPALPEHARRPVPAGSSARDLAWQSQLTESVDAIRTLLLHSARSEALQVIMVTSALSGEGKTSLASQLAASLARAWRKTLLIDGDLRNPGAHALFGLPQEPGLSEVLRGEINPADAIRPTPLGRLWFMPAGHYDSHAVQALAQDGVRATFGQLKGQYDFIIVDSCPVLPVADSLLLGQHVDAVIFSILRDVSRLPTVYSAQQRLASLGIRTLGAVVIGDQSMTSRNVYQPLAQTVT